MKAAAYILMEPKGIEIITEKVSSEESIGEAAKYIPLDFFNCEKTSSINEISELICGKIVDIDKTQKIDELIFIGGSQETVLIEEDMDMGFTRRDIEEVAESYTSNL